MSTSVKDHGYAWVVCVASCLAQVVQGGLLYSMGVLYIMFKNGLDAGDGALSLVTSLNYSILYIVGPFVGILTERFGERRLALVGAVIATVGLAFTSFSTKVWHLYLAYSLTAGIGMGMVYNPSISILAKYFDKYKKVAAGISTCGHGIGSFLFPPILKVLENAFGWRGAILMLAGIAFHYLIFAVLYRPTTEKAIHVTDVNEDYKEDRIQKEEYIVTNENHEKEKEKEETPFMNSESKSHKEGDFGKDNGKDIQSHHVTAQTTTTTHVQSRNAFTDSLALLKIIPFLCLCLHGALLHFPIVLVYTHFGSYVLSLEFSSRDVIILYMAMGITNTVTRVLLGILAEVFKVDCAMVIMVSAFINGILAMCVPLTHQLPAMYVYVVLFCSLITPYNTLFLPILVDSVPQGKVATAYGIVCFFCVPGTALGAPLAAWLHGNTHTYDSSFYLAGVLFLLSGLAMVPGIYQNYVHRRRTR